MYQDPNANQNPPPGAPPPAGFSGNLPPGWSIDPNTGNVIPPKSGWDTPHNPGDIFDPGTNTWLPPGDPRNTPAQPTPPPANNPPPAGGPPPGGPNPLAPYGAPPPSLDPTVNLGGPKGIPYIPPTPTFTAPTFNAPAFPNIPKFENPSVGDALNDPGYQFRVQQGDQGLQNWAAARGTLNDPETATALENYNQGAASQEYANVWNRDYSAYQTNVQNQYVAPYEAAYNGWLQGTVGPGMQGWMAGTVGPGMQGYQTQAAAGQHQNDVNYQNAFNTWLQQGNFYQNWQNNVGMPLTPH